jgi:hypothetical protein
MPSASSPFAIAVETFSARSTVEESPNVVDEEVQRCVRVGDESLPPLWRISNLKMNFDSSIQLTGVQPCLMPSKLKCGRPRRGSFAASL